MKRQQAMSTMLDQVPTFEGDDEEKIKSIRLYLNTFEKEVKENTESVDRILVECGEHGVSEEDLVDLKRQRQMVEERMVRLREEEGQMVGKARLAEESQGLVDEWEGKREKLMGVLEEQVRSLKELRGRCLEGDMIQDVKNCINGIEKEKGKLSGLYESTRHAVKSIKKGVAPAKVVEIKKLQQKLEEKWSEVDDEVAKGRDHCHETLTFYRDEDLFRRWIHTKNQLLHTIGKLSPDPTFTTYQLDQLHLLREEVENHTTQHQSLTRVASKLISCSLSEHFAEHIANKISDVNQQWECLESKLKQTTVNLAECKSRCGRFEKVGGEIRDLLLGIEKDIDRKTFSLTSHLSDLDQVLEALEEDILNRGANLVEPLLSNSQQIINSLNEMSGDKSVWKQLQDDLDTSKARVDQLINKVNNIRELTKVSKEATEIIGKIEKALDDPILSKDIGDDIITLKSQQNELNNFKNKDVNELKNEFEKVVGACKNLLKSSDKSIPSGNLEVVLDNIQKNWLELTHQVGVRDRAISTKMQGIGNYEDAYRALCNWLEETEELVNDQKKPSIDRKVLKTELQNHKFSMKLIEDKEPNIKDFVIMMGKLIEASNVEEKISKFNEKANHIDGRYTYLRDYCVNRSNLLLEALDYSEAWATNTTHLNQWLDEVEDELKEIGKVVTEPEKILKQLERQQKLTKEISDKREEFVYVVKLFDTFVELVSESDGEELNDSVNSLESRYIDVEERCHDIGKSLVEMKDNLDSFFDDTDHLTLFLNKTEAQLEQFNDIPIATDELIAQSEKLAEIVAEVAARADLVSRIVEDSRELCSNTSGNEALQLQYKIDALHQRYSQIASLSDRKIDTMSTAIPLSEDFSTLYDDLARVLENVDNELHNLENEYMPLSNQVDIINELQSALHEQRSQLDYLNTKSVQLQGLSSEDKGNDLKEQTRSLQDDFMKLSDIVSRRGERLRIEASTNQDTFDKLDSLHEWFKEAHQFFPKTDPPSIYPDTLKEQIKFQKKFNEDIISQKSKLREILMEASRVAKNLHDSEDGHQDESLSDKIESTKIVAEEVAKMSNDRLDILEQANEFYVVLEENLNDLKEWLEGMEEELDEASNSGFPVKPDQLLKLKQQTAGWLSAVHTQKGMFDKFEKNVGVFKQITSKDDGDELEMVSDGVYKRWQRIRAFLLKREEELEGAFGGSSQLGDRLDAIIETFEGIGDRIHAAPPVKSTPPEIKIQIMENEGLLDVVINKQPIFEDLSNECANLLSKPNVNESLSKEIEGKGLRLGDLYSHLLESINMRDALLNNTLQKAELFWGEYGEVKGFVDGLKDKLIKIPLDMSSEPSEMENNRRKLAMMGNELASYEGAIAKMKVDGEGLCAFLDEEEGENVEHAISLIEADTHTISQLFSQASSDFGTAIDKSTNYHALFKKLMQFVIHMEEVVYNLPHVDTTSIAQIQKEIDKIGSLQSEIEEHAHLKDQLNQSAQDLLLTAQPNQIVAVRGPLNELNNKWNNIFQTIGSRYQKLERCLLESGQFCQAYDQIMMWMMKTGGNLDDIIVTKGDLRLLEIQLSKLNVIRNDISGHESAVGDINRAGKNLKNLDPSGEALTVQKLSELNGRWNDLNDKLDALLHQVESAKNEASTMDHELDDWMMWLGDIEADLTMHKPIGGLPETAESQLDDFLVVNAQVQQRRDELNKLVNQKINPNWSQKNLDKIKGKWEGLQEKVEEKQKKLKGALEEAHKLQKEIEDVAAFIATSDTYLATVPQISRIPDTIKDQVEAQNEFGAKVEHYKGKVGDLSAKATKIRLVCEKKDAIPIKNKLATMRHQFDKINTKSNERQKNLEAALKDATSFYDDHKSMMAWIKEKEEKLKDGPIISTTGDRIRDQINSENEFREQLASKQPLISSLQKKGKLLEEASPKNEKPAISKMSNDLKNKWNSLNDDSSHRLQLLQDALLQNGRFEEGLEGINNWLGKHLPSIRGDIDTNNLYGDVESVQHLIKEHNKLKDEIVKQKGAVDKVTKRFNEILNKEPEAVCEEIRDSVGEMNKNLGDLDELANKKDSILELALVKARDFEEKLNDLLGWIGNVEGSLKRNSIPNNQLTDEAFLIEQIESLEYTLDEIESKDPDFKDAVKVGDEILKDVHVIAEMPVKDCINMLTRRWDTFKALIKDRHLKMEESLKDFRQNEALLDELTAFVEKKHHELNDVFDVSDINSLDDVENRIGDHENFKQQLHTKQQPVEEAIKGYKKALISANIIAPSDGMTTSAFGYSSFDGNDGKKIKLGMLPGQKSMNKQQRKGDDLNNEWKKLWLNSTHYDQALLDRKAYLEEVKRLENFSFDEWRDRYIDFNDHAKGRVTDIFRKIAKYGPENFPRHIFIKAILASKFVTTPLEMERVADKFDKGDRMINAKQFINALRIDPRKRQKHQTDQERIVHEIDRQSNRCTCGQRFPIQHLGVNKEYVTYRFGAANSVTRMVRILQSTIMVRVGGGWEEIDSFLMKHDPCRAKGKTNVDLFFKNVRPGGVSDQMREFALKPPSTPTSRKSSTGGSVTPSPRDILGFSPGTPGPISKIREKTDRSMPMFSHSRKSSTDN
uniref:GAR domain-containing protein n=1 Tax=Rhabditophanes sp. KR3021 TaxID=114890 RepID=A0AC35UFF8_9BILA